MSIVQLQHTLFNLLPQLSEGQFRKLMEFVNSMLAVQQPQPVPKPSTANKRDIKVIADESSQLEMTDIYMALPSANSFEVKVKVVAVTSMAPITISSLT